MNELYGNQPQRQSEEAPGMTPSQGSIPSPNDQATYAHSHLNKGEDYESRFDTLPGRRLMWDLEKSAIDRFIEGRAFSSYLDFACGTGRILRHVSPRASQSVGVDVSDKMLAVCRRIDPQSNLVLGDFRDGLETLEGIKFDLITAFRFFPNAEPELRISAMKFLRSRLLDHGMMIINNHRNYHSLSSMTGRLLGRNIGQVGMTHGEILALADECELSITSTISLGVIPQTESRSALPWPMTAALEHAIARFFGTRHLRGYNCLYVLEPSG